MVSGKKAVFDRIEPAIKQFGKLFFCGEGAGLAQVMKLANNIIAAGVIVMSAEVIAMGTKAGLNPRQMCDIINAGSGRNAATQDTLAAALGAAILVAWLAYRHVPIAPGRRRLLSALRFATLVWIVVCLMRPMIRATDAAARDAVVPILVDSSAAWGSPTPTGPAASIARADSIAGDLLPALSPRFHTEVLRFGDRMTCDGRRRAWPRPIGGPASAPRSRPCAIATAAAPSPASSSITDGGDNGVVDAAAAAAAGAPVYAIGIGPEIGRRATGKWSASPRRSRC